MVEVSFIDESSHGSSIVRLELPYNWSARPYQSEFMSYLDAGGKRAVCVWHRRAGKDTCSAHQICKMAHQRIGLYWHMLPTQRQARKVVWDAITNKGVNFIDAVYPEVLRSKKKNATDMKVELKCGSVIQLVGSDNYDSLVGANPVGVVFSEYSVTNPKSWELIRPILRENKGWAAFIYTPRGYNHGWAIKKIAESEPDWFYSLRNYQHTGVLTDEDIEAERREGMPDELVRQEYLCDFAASNLGSILGRYLEAAERDGRITDENLYDPNGADVVASADIGFRDAAAFWIWQQRADGFALLDYIEDSGMDADDWIQRLHALDPAPSVIYLPHDARAKTFATRHSVLERFLRGGFQSVRVVPRVSIHDRINAARFIFPRCHFAKAATEEGIEALRAWEFEWDDERKEFSKEPNHNWASHGGDAFSYGAMVLSRHIKDVPITRERTREETEARGLHYAFNLDGLFKDHEEVRQRRSL